jgi:hypothetical protein
MEPRRGHASTAKSAVLLAASAVLLWNLLVGGRVGHTVALGVVLVGVLACLVAVAAAKPIEFILGTWVIFVLQQPLGAYVGSGSHEGAVLVGRVDDGAILVLGVAMLWRWVSGRCVYTRNSAWVVCLTGLLAAIGVASAALTSDFGVWTVVGAWLTLKIWVVLAAFISAPWKGADFDRITKVILWTAAVVAVFGVIDYVSASTLQSLLHTTPDVVDPLQRSRSHYVQSVFPSPSRYSNFMTVAVALALARYAVERRPLYLAIALLLGTAGLASLRLRGLLAIIAVVVALVALVKESRLSRTMQLTAAVVVCVFVIGPAAFTGQFDRFTSQTDATARGQLYTDGIKLAEQRFPFGTGFGTYGSYASVLYYSPLYDKLGLSSEYGFSRESPLYLTDTSWAGFIAELGFIGTGLVIFGLIRVGAQLTIIARRSGPDRGPATAALTVLVAAVTMSIGSAALLDSVVVSAVGMLTACALASQRIPATAHARANPAPVGSSS